MDFKQNIPKYKPKLLSWLLILAITLTTFLQYPITAHAAGDGVDWAGAAAYVNSTHDNEYGGNTKIQNGVNIDRTGYMCYMVDAESGAITSEPKAFYAGTNFIGGSQWIASTRHGAKTVSSWTGPAPWGKPWIPPEGSGSNVTSLEPQIKDWFREYGDDFVQENFPANHDNFVADTEVLVIETLMNVQFSIADSATSAAAEADKIVSGYKDYELCRIVAQYGWTNAMEEYARYKAEGAISALTSMLNTIRRNLKTQLTLLMEAEGFGAGRTYYEPPVIGSVPNLIAYDTWGTTVFDSYLNSAAPHAEKIDYSEAGFEKFTGSGKMTDAEVQQYGVAMLIIHCKEDAIRTYWEPNGSPGDPEPSLPNKTGKCNIVKCYYNENLTTHVKTDLGTFTRKDCTNKIIISGEPGFELVEWRVTNQTDLSHHSLTWSPPGTTSQNGTLGKTVTLKEPETCVYVLLRKVEEEEVEEEEYNYILKESQITRRVYFSFPDEDTAKYKDSPQSNMNSPYIYEHEFRWLSPKVPICKGHPYMDDCPWHDPGCNENCLEDCDIDHSFQHDYDCVEATAYCKDPEWEEKRLLLSINNTLQEDYQNVLVPQATWNREVELEKETKHYYKDDQPFDRQVLEDIEWHPESGGYPNWDYICVLMRGADKLTLAEWENHGDGNQDRTEADLLVNVSEAGFTMANQDSGTRKTKTYYEVFNAKFTEEELTPGGVYFFLLIFRKGIMSTVNNYLYWVLWIYKYRMIIFL